MRNIYPHYDPLNEFEGDYIYDGLEWGCNGEYIGGPLNNEWTEGNKHGAAATRRIITQAGQSEMNLNENPAQRRNIAITRTSAMPMEPYRA